MDKMLKDVRSTQSKCDDISVKEIKVLREELTGLGSVSSELKTCSAPVRGDRITSHDTAYRRAYRAPKAGAILNTTMEMV